MIYAIALRDKESVTHLTRKIDSLGVLSLALSGLCYREIQYTFSRVSMRDDFQHSGLFSLHFDI